ncbi:MAG: hypothetical protein JSV27_09050 [Candidatus Bathyarchaeota archaeon]|nr:MAG: hypothetical protein JSV27_09050 [Candidatus Bathyarchaeota archaeon]
MVRYERWAFNKLKYDGLALWVVVGVFITLWGVSELLGDTYWWASRQFLWDIFLLGVGPTIVVRTLQKMKALK